MLIYAKVGLEFLKWIFCLTKTWCLVLQWYFHFLNEPFSFEIHHIKMSNSIYGYMHFWQSLELKLAQKIWWSGRESHTKKSSKIFAELWASSSLVSENEKLSVTLNILIHKICCFKSLLNSKNVLTRKGSKI